MTLVPREKVMEAEIEVGSECKVKQGRKVYTGKIAAIGKHSVEYTQLSLAGQVHLKRLGPASPDKPRLKPWPINLIGHGLRRGL